MASNKRERELARMRAERQAARRAAAEAARKRRQRTVLTTLAVVVAVGIAATVFLTTRGGDKKTDTLTQALPTSTPGTGDGTCTYKKSGTSAKKYTGSPTTQGVRTTGTQKVTFTLTQGVVEGTLLTSKAPCTVNSFAFLAGQKYFDNTPCPRLVTSGIYVLQCGDPSGTTGGGPGYTFDDENLAGATYPAGTIAMANGGPSTNGSQFFLVYKDTQLGPSYTPFGTITKGLDVLEKIAKGGDDGSNPAGGGKPKTPVSLLKVVVTG